MTKLRLTLFLAFIFLVTLFWNQGTYWYWRNNPELAFKAVTSRSLPNGIQVVAYESELNDNFLHRTHYWIIAGSPELLQEVIKSHRFQKSDDAAWAKPNVERLFNIRLDVMDGFEEDEQGRNRWFWVSTDQTKGLYAY